MLSIIAMADTGGLRFKVILLGNMEIGKTSLIVRFTDDTFNEDDVVEIDQKDRTLEVDGKEVKILITDTAGQERFRTLTSSYYRNADAILLCYSVDDATSFEDVEGHMQEGSRYSQRSAKFVVATKSDVEDPAVSDQDGEEFAKSKDMPFFKTSAKTGEGVEELFTAVAKKLASSGAGGIAPGSSLVIGGNAKQQRKTGGLCMV